MLCKLIHEMGVFTYSNTSVGSGGLFVYIFLKLLAIVVIFTEHVLTIAFIPVILFISQATEGLYNMEFNMGCFCDPQSWTSLNKPVSYQGFRTHWGSCDLTLMLYSVENHALEVHTWQSTTYASYSIADRAVDGDERTSFWHCTRTRKESWPTWRVDLGDICRVAYINITNHSGA